jgi:hypothetical protein
MHRVHPSRVQICVRVPSVLGRELVNDLMVRTVGVAVDSASPPVLSDPNARGLRNLHVGFEREDYTDPIGR